MLSESVNCDLILDQMFLSSFNRKYVSTEYVFSWWFSWWQLTHLLRRMAQIDFDDSSSDDDFRPEDPFALQKSDSGITRHLKTNSECLSTLSKTNHLASFFTILARARNDTHLAVLETIFIASYQPALCSDKDHGRCLTLFWSWFLFDLLVLSLPLSQFCLYLRPFLCPL